MGSVNTILQQAKERAEQQSLPYSGAVTPQEAWHLLQSVPRTKLVDVRSHAEWQFVGVIPDAVQIELKAFPGMRDNPHFLDQLKAQVDPEAVVLFLCRSGARSDQAARLAAEQGYSNAYNILEGFEGDKDGNSHRNTINGWRASGLPWVQT